MDAIVESKFFKVLDDFVLKDKLKKDICIKFTRIDNPLLQVSLMEYSDKYRGKGARPIYYRVWLIPKNPRNRKEATALFKLMLVEYRKLL